MHDQTAVWTTPASTSGGDVKGGGSSPATSFAGKMPASTGVPSGMRQASGRTLQTGAQRRAASVATAVDEHGVIREPEEGVHTTYKRVGTAYFLHEQEVYFAPQSGTVELVETGDGTVYVKDIISHFSFDCLK